MGKIDNKNVFVPYAVPGEKLEIEITQSFRDYDEAKIVKVLEASPKRVLPACPLYGTLTGPTRRSLRREFWPSSWKGPA